LEIPKEINPAGLQKGPKKMKSHTCHVGLPMIVVAVSALGVIAGDGATVGVGIRGCAVGGR
jgi:hypothetical protein